MKIVCISDTHGVHGKLGKLPEADMLIHAGDFSVDSPPIGAVEDLIFFNRWIKDQPFRHKIIIAGNHDFLFQKDRVISRQIITDAVYLQDSGTKIDGLKYWGMPWTPTYMNWAFMVSEKRMKLYTDRIPDDVDVLITHGPPYGIMDKVGRENVGSKNLLQAVKRVKPKVHIFGHIHEGYGLMSLDGVIFVNACSLNEWYEPVNKPILVEV